VYLIIDRTIATTDIKNVIIPPIVLKGSVLNELQIL
jgi:hypothetical protein